MNAVPSDIEQLLLSMVGELHPDDGVDPEQLRKRDRSGKHVKPRKLAALCRQVHETLALTVPADLGLDVVSVTPGADPSRLIVILTPSPGDPAPDIEERLRALAGPLRAEVARSIHRRRTPTLDFRVVPAGAS